MTSSYPAQKTAGLSLPDLPLSPSVETRPWKVHLLRLRLLFAMFRLVARVAGNPLRAGVWMRMLLRKYKAVNGNDIASKIAHVGGKYYWRIGAAGFPGPALFRYWESELNREFHFRAPFGLRNVYFAITKKCPYRCEHCFEWEHLNKPETLSRQDILDIVRKYQEYGAGQIIFGGGEPLIRIKDILATLESTRWDSDFWIVSSGYSLTPEKARRLKEAGLTGMIISLDHWQAGANDRFRGFDGAFDVAVSAVQYARSAGMVAALSLCATREFCTRDNLRAYLELARKLGVAFVQLLEPMPVGHYHDQDVVLGPEHREILEAFYRSYNREPDYSDYPIIDYQGSIVRRAGCFGAGNRYLYIDTDGNVHRCPFCREKTAKALAFPVADVVELLKEQGCGRFEDGTL